MTVLLGNITVFKDMCEFTDMYAPLTQMKCFRTTRIFEDMGILYMSAMMLCYSYS